MVKAHPDQYIEQPEESGFQKAEISSQQPEPLNFSGYRECAHVETVALLGRKQVSDYLHIAVNTEDLETDVGRIYTNDDIKQYIEEKYGFKVHSAYIGQVREKLGIREHENYRDSHTSPRKPTICPEEKEAAIMDALKHFGLIQ